MTGIDKGAEPSFPFGDRFTESEMFRQVFGEGMGLVEETANYLDGTGRAESRRLSRAAALAYATESMRLTTRLMQVASWLLIQRAVGEGEMPAGEAAREANRIPLKPPSGAPDRPNFDALPHTLRDLIVRADRVYGRIYRLDRMMVPGAAAASPAANPVVDQIDRLRSAFAPDGTQKKA